MTRSDRLATLEEAKVQFQKSWDAWKAWAKLRGHPGPGLNAPAGFPESWRGILETLACNRRGKGHACDRSLVFSDINAPVAIGCRVAHQVADYFTSEGERIAIVAQFHDAEVFGPDLSACDETIEGHLTRLSGPNCSRCSIFHT
jgi:hypothetical protein